MSTYKASGRAWWEVEGLSGPGSAGNQCILELRSRIEALEAAANSSAGLTGSNHPAIPDSSPAPAGGLVEQVECAMRDAPGDGYGWENEARAAILAVADWLQGQKVIAGRAAARWLREEVERG